MILCLWERRARCVFSVYCRKNSAIRPEEGAPIARPSYCVIVVGEIVLFGDDIIPH